MYLVVTGCAPVSSNGCSQLVMDGTQSLFARLSTDASRDKLRRLGSSIIELDRLLTQKPPEPVPKSRISNGDIEIFELPSGKD